MSSKAFSSIRSAAIDGRAWNPFFKKTQLKKLHEALVARASNIKAAMEKDTGNTRFEIATEYWLALRCLAQVYDSIDTDTELKLEYRIANSKDASDARDPVGIVVIEPLAQTFLYSLLSALAPALGAGNCVIVQMGRSMLATPNIVLPLIQAALVDGTFEISYTTVSDIDINHRHCRILQNGSTAAPLAHHIVSESQNRIIAVVERDADVDEAARSLVTARFSLRGKSAYAPDLVLVNEWIRKDFLAALSRQSIALGNSYVSETRPAKASASSNLVQEVMKGGSGSVHSTSQYGAIVEIEERRSDLLGRKTDEPCLVVHPVTSMDDAIDVASGFGRLSAAYVFTAPGAAKYICQFLNASICLVNHIPLKLLYGPIAPTDHSFSPDTLTPYSERHFTLAKGQFIEPTKDGQRLAQLFFEASPKGCRILHEEASAPLKDMNRVKKGGDIGFFNQGIVTGGIIVLSTAISCTGLLCYYLVKVARSTL
ncbi:hypothetical protein BN1723_006863 [Verticillium longisporum]|uniref:Aldehyde dehydrogenase domain-containing protein n=1 Tax=Verticillium longisporum TaxID=100787 RepID=A0A0G4M429_VERLO|nr:hypothetical protein HYQ44_007461 [Verticillium longisporum]KAG7152821.1 hypothetical protein HYQ46_005291 [Verticillium longisporum]CRK29019.1 hypothetical protein BN1708_004842 [Verticillium longisporum]CRK46084.1 hypothetical protein BN1723_006863 [Verticillium longisporum]